MVFRRWRHLFTFLASILLLAARRRNPLRQLLPAPALRRDGHRPLGGLLVPLPSRGAAGRRPHRHRLLAGARGPTAAMGQAGDRGGPGRLRLRAALPGCRPSLRRARRPRSRRSDPARCASGCFTPNDLVPGGLRAGQDGTSRRRRQARRGHPARDQRAARADGARRQAGRARGIRRLDAAATPRGGRSRHLPVRQALRDEPRARRPLVQAGPDDPLRPARGRGAVPDVSAGWSSTRTTRSACCATPASPPRRRTGSSRSRPSASTCSSRGSSRARRRSATPRSTTTSSTRRSRSSAGCGTRGSAHRDIKPANLLVRDGQVFLIDAFFVQVRPSPWRQAVDLGEHDAGPRRPHRRRAGVRAGAALLHARRDRRGVRGDAWGRQPHPAADGR